MDVIIAKIRDTWGLPPPLRSLRGILSCPRGARAGGWQRELCGWSRVSQGRL